MTVVIALVVIALFFALLTVERTGLYGVLKAIGARSRTLIAGLVVQAVVVTLIAAAVAGVAVVVLDLLIPPGSIPLYISPGRIVSSVVLLLVAAVRRLRVLTPPGPADRPGLGPRELTP